MKEIKLDEVDCVEIHAQYLLQELRKIGARYKLDGSKVVVIVNNNPVSIITLDNQ